MKITNKMQTAMDLLTAEFAFRFNRDRFANCDLDVYKYDDQDYTVLGLSCKEFYKLVGAKPAKGANSTALVFKNAVIKWETNAGDSFHRTSDAKSAERLFRTVEKQKSHLLPNISETMVIDRFVIQERVKPTEDWASVPEDLRITVAKSIIDVAVELGLGDLHTSNWGFRPSDKRRKTAVVFDFSDQSAFGHWTDPKDVVDAVGVNTWDELFTDSDVWELEDYAERKLNFFPNV